MKVERKTKKQLIEELEAEPQQRAVKHAAQQVREAVLAMRGSLDLPQEDDQTIVVVAVEREHG